MLARSSRLAQLLAPFALFLVLTLSAAHAPAQQPSQRSLYERLGGYDAVAAVVDDFITRLASDPQLSRFLVGLSTDSKKKLRQHVLNQFCQATGGPCVYTGRDMKTSHAGLGITEKEWDAGAKHLVAALDKFKVGEREKSEVVAFVSSLKKDIVEK
ncbi:MAG TPA: group 1 truncated hemoglobin [Pyrinomonadaceae bacterium]|nr:group 1 truncated hemoglobin [Pyrinomonadaceae bacterium]